MVVAQIKMRYEDPFDVDAFINSLLFLKKYPGKNVSNVPSLVVTDLSL
ncbi:hypothetical protein E2C01_078813 [Portunus trituberculatus]|uniref:Uncharacterized protein n=1 Tax=Portunus trituberculatus TaxID=210409 RepID=A0A5B7IR48_PORTR|nr:hypothetical protein [Portunus trituberculatus]